MLGLSAAADLNPGLKDSLHCGSRLGDRLRVVDRVRQRGFTINVLTGGDCVQRDLLVLMGWRGDENRLNCLVIQNGLVVRDELSARRDRSRLLDESRYRIGIANRSHWSA